MVIEFISCGQFMDKHPIYRLRLPKKYECISVGKSIIGNKLPTKFGSAGTWVLVTLRIICSLVLALPT